MKIGLIILSPLVASVALADGVAIMQNVGSPPSLQYYGSAPSAFFFPDNAASGTGPRIAVGDITGDGADDIVVAPVSGASKVFVYSGTGFLTKTSFPIASTILDPSVAVSPWEPGRAARIIVGYGPTNNPIINVFNGSTGAAMASFFAFDPTFKGGVRVSAGDVTGDGIPDIVAGQATGGPIVRVFDGNDFTLISSFDAYSGNFTGGVNVAAGDVNGDNICEIAVGPTSGAQPIRILNAISGAEIQNFFAFSPSFQGGVNVAASDHDRDGYDDIVMSVRGGGPPTVRVFSMFKGINLANFSAYADSYTGGTCVGGSIHRTPRTTFRIPTADNYYRGPATDVAVDIEARNPAGVAVSTQNKNLLVDGRVQFDVDFRGNLRVRLKPKGRLSRVINASATGAVVNLAPLSFFPGDCNGDDYVGTDDYLVINNAYDTSFGDALFDPRADVDGDKYVGTDDYLLMNENFDKTGETM